MNRLQQESTAAADYLVGVNPRMWVNAMIPGGVGRIFGQRASNAVESMNDFLKAICSHGILDILMGLWHEQMGQRYERLQDALGTGFAYPPTAHAFIRDEQQRARPFLVTNGALRCCHG